MVEYDELTKKNYDEINKFFMDAFSIRKGVSFKCGDTYYNVIRLNRGDYLLSELEVDRGGYVVDATTVLSFETLSGVIKFISDLVKF